MNRRTAAVALVALVVIGAAAVFIAVPSGDRTRDEGGDSRSRRSGRSTANMATTPTTVLPPLERDGTATAGRPPQFVVISFDGSGSLDLMQHWLDIGDRASARFSFFLTGVYLLDAAHKDVYVGPHHKPGVSSVGFALVPPGQTTQQFLSSLVERLTFARENGHEVGTHYNGHFCSGVPNPVGTWDGADWSNELDQFDSLAANISKNNGLSTPVPSPLDPRGVIGGRTPCLEGKMEVLYPVLARRGFRYDASRTGTMGEWPSKYLGLWSMTLDSIPLAGTKRSALSMDYNLYYSYAGAKNVDPQQAAQISEWSYQSYVNYFENSYYGNRAPIDLGNHFERWDNSAYTDALTRFVLTQCTRPEARCVPYRDLVDWLDARTPDQLRAFSAGFFSHMPRPGQLPAAPPPSTTAPGSGNTQWR